MSLHHTNSNIDNYFKEPFLPSVPSSHKARTLYRKTFGEAWLRYFILKWMGKHNDLVGYNAASLMSHTDLDIELKRLLDTHTLHEYLLHWTEHQCADTTNCSKFFTMDGNVKNSHPVCACAIGSEGSSFYECEETGPIPIGCANPPQPGKNLCVQCEARLQVRAEGHDAPEHPFDTDADQEGESDDDQEEADDEEEAKGGQAEEEGPGMEDASAGGSATPSLPRRGARTKRPPERLAAYKTDTDAEIIGKVLATRKIRYDAGE